MRNPNGYGTVVKLSGKRRKPYAARVTVGWELGNGTATQKTKYIGYFATKAEAVRFLANYSGVEDVTLADLFNRWSTEKFKTLSDNSITSYNSIWKMFAPIAGRVVSSIRLDDLQTLANESGKNKPTLTLYKLLCQQLFDYAYKHEYIDANKREIPKFIEVGNNNPKKIKRIPFSFAELQTLWNHSNDEMARHILTLIYSGLRISEYCSLTADDIEDGCFIIRKAKTPSGVRSVPIADKIAPFVNVEPMNAQKFRRQFVEYLLKLGMEHLPHDTRHTTVSMLNERKVEITTIRAIVGHSDRNVTEHYTHISIEQMRQAINLL